MKRMQKIMNKLVYLVPTIYEISERVIYEFWYDYVKGKYGEKAKLCYVGTDIFIVYIKTEDIYADIAKDFGKIFDTSNWELEIALPRGRKEKFIGFMKDE